MVSITFSSCSDNGITSSDLEGEWKMYKIKYPNSYQYSKVTDNIYYKFTNGNKSSGVMEINSENDSKVTAEYEIENNNYISVDLPGNSPYTKRFFVTASVGVLKLEGSSNYSNYDYIFIRE